MDSNLHNRRSSGEADRRKSWGTNLLQGEVPDNFLAVREAAADAADAPDEEALSELNTRLRLANERLVIATIEAQILNDEIEKSKVALSHLAYHDFLTNLPNRTQLHDRLAQAIAYAKRHTEKLAVLFLDLDRFKIVNDTLGHAIGDQLLQGVAQRLQSAIRSSDIVIRQGGDEFILVLSEVNQEETLALKVEEIREIITAPYSIEGHDLLIGATIGIAVFPQDGETAETLIRNADDAMYYAKESGRNKYQFFDPAIRTRTS